jgi:hypothetical protein
MLSSRLLVVAPPPLEKNVEILGQMSKVVYKDRRRMIAFILIFFFKKKKIEPTSHVAFL